MKRRKGKILGLFLAAVLAVMGTAPHAAAHPQTTKVTTSFVEGWSFHYPDGHTSSGGYFRVWETGERLFCLEPHVNTVESTRTQWTTLSQYFHDADFAKKLSLTAYYGENSGWGLDGWAAAQSLIWKYIMQRNGETGEQWVSTASITTRAQMQTYYDAIEQKVKAYNTVPSFDKQTITLQAGQSTTITDTKGALADMKVETSGPIQVSKNGNQLTVTATGVDAGRGTVSLEKQLAKGTKGENFAYTAAGYQDLMTYGGYEPVQAALTVEVTEAPVSMQLSKQDITTGQELPGAGMQVTDGGGNVVDAWTSGTEPHWIHNLKKGSVYTLTETFPAPGYATAASITFTAAHGAAPVVMKDEITKIQVSKKDLTTGQELPGATLQVTDRAGAVVDQWVSGSEPHMITKLVVGETYRLTELMSAPGYATAGSVSFTVADTGDIQKVQMEDDITKFEISKTDITTGEELPGATLRVTDAEGKLIEEWISGKTPHPMTKLTVGETYTLTEILPAPGYTTAEAVTFVVADTGSLQKIQMKDDITRFEISKKDLTTGEELPGARLQVTDIKGNLIDEWISEEAPHRITKLTAGETYILTETLPAPGYATAEPVTFVAADTGSLQKIQMKDDITRFEISKKDLTTGEELPGARLQVTDTEGNLIDEWISEEIPHRITKLTAGETYILTETLPAPGYATAEAVTFTVTDTGEIQKLEMKDDITKIHIQKIGRSTEKDDTGETAEKEGTEGVLEKISEGILKEIPEKAPEEVSGEAMEEKEGISGAALQVTDTEGNVVDEWVTDGKPHVIEGLVVGETYVLTELSPAPGYATAEPVTFTVADTEEIQWILMEDEITKVDIVKTDLTTGKELPGARLQITDAEGAVIDEWISEDVPHRISKLKAGGTYTLTETYPAEGYATAEAVVFTVEDTGEIQKVTMEDDITKTEVSKVDAADGKTLPGAVLQILDEEGEVFCEWTSEKEPRLVEKLTVGKTYILHEAEAPEGYLTAEDVEFTVSDTGEVQTVAIEDELAVINLEVAKQTIRRTQTGDTYKYIITLLHNASNTALENFTCTDYLPEQVTIRELHTGTFSDELEYSIAYQTNRSEEWHSLVRGLNSTANHIVSFDSIPLEKGEQVTAYRYEFGTAPAGFQIAGQNPVYFTTVKPGVDVADEMLTNITLSGDWRGVSVTDKDDTVTLLFEGRIEPLRSFGRIVTGDASPSVYLLLLAAVSLGVVIFLAVRKHKVSRREQD